MSTATTQITRRTRASPAETYRALVEPDLVAAWRFPDGMSIEVHDYDLREGGRFRISLTYQDPTAQGKSRGHTDTYHGHFAVLEPEREVVQVMEFESDDPAMQGEMTVRFTLGADGDGTVLHTTHEKVPPGVSLQDNELGWTMALDRLTALLETRL